MITTPLNLGTGIYSPEEAAFYAKVPTSTMVRWIFGNPQGKPVIERQVQGTGQKVVTFLDLVQILAVRETRQRYSISLPKIREAVDEAKRRYDLEHPLARQHSIFLFGDPQTPGHQQIVIALHGEQRSQLLEYVQLTGRHKGNLLLGPVVEMFLKDLRFDNVTGLAMQYRPMVGKGCAIILDPARRFGEPLVEPGGYTAEALWHATSVEGSFEAAALVCGVSMDEVELANKYYDTLLASKAM